MADLEDSAGFAVRGWASDNIDHADLTGDGFETNPHVTVLWGFAEDTSVKDLEEFLAQFKRIDIKLGCVSFFTTNPDYDVVKIDVISPDLVSLNSALKSQFPSCVQEVHVEYNPHLTLAFVKKGACRHIDGHARFEGSLFRMKSLVYSWPESAKKLEIELG